MKDRELNLYDILYGGCLMGLPFFLCPEGSDWRVLLLFLASLAFFEVSVRVKSVLLYLVLWGAMCVFFPRTGGNLPEQLCILGGVLLGGIGYFWGRWKGEAGFFTGPEYGALAIGAVVYGVAYFQEITYLKGRACLFAAAVFLLCVLSANREALLDYLKENEKLHRFPGKRLEKKNRFIMGALALLLATIMALAYWNAPADPAMPEPRQVTMKEPETEQPFMQPETEVNFDELFGGDMEEAREMPEWLKMLGNILYHVILWGMFGGLLAGVIYGLYKLASGYRGQFGTTGAVKPLSEEDVLENLEPPKFFAAKLFRKRTPTEQVRRIYKKWILNGPGGIPMPASTPAEAEALAEVSDEEMHALYEKARYSNKECTEEDAARMRKKPGHRVT